MLLTHAETGPLIFWR